MTEHTDPEGMPEDERMTAAELKVVREFLGVTGDWLAGHLGVNPRTVRNWEEGRRAIPDGVRLAVEDLEARTGEFVSRIIDALMDVPGEPTAVTYRTDDEYRSAHPDEPFSASWHRAVIARVAQEVPTLSIVYASDVPAEVAR